MTSSVGSHKEPGVGTVAFGDESGLTAGRNSSSSRAVRSAGMASKGSSRRRGGSRGERGRGGDRSKEQRRQEL